MRKSVFPLCTLIFIFVYGISTAQDTPALMKKVEGFSHPESVILDEDKNILYISNIGEDTPGDGFISKVSLDGEIQDLKWIAGLNDPKGLLLHDNKLYVTDNKEFVTMDTSTGEITEKISVEDAVFLNDITADENGNIYFSDSRKSSIYKMEKSGEISEWLNTEKLEYNNGLLAVEDNLYAAAWGAEGSGGGNVLRIDYDSKEINKVSKKGIGNLDGIQKIDSGGFYISDWGTGKIYRIDEEGKTEEILTSEKSAGDILFLKKENQLILPMNFQNEVWWYQLK